MLLFMDARHEIFILLVLGFSKDITLPPKISEVLNFRFQRRNKTFTWNFTLVLNAVHFTYCTFQQHMNSEL